MATAAFDQLKRESLRKLRDMEDKSPKGSVDAPIVEMIRMINDHHNYVTSSSCSGRIAVFRGVPSTNVARGDDAPSSSSDHLITKGGKWLLAEHATITIDQLRESLATAVQSSSQSDELTASNMVIFKHEPFIMHVVCRDIEAAKDLLQVGIACGFRESGIVVGNKKIMCAIRTTANAMEIPLGRSVDALMVDDAYLQWIVDIANDKFVANRLKTDNLWAAFRKSFTAAPSTTVNPTTHATRTSAGSAKRSPSTVSMRRSLPLSDSVGGVQRLHRVGHTSVQYNNRVYVFAGQGQSTSGTASRLNDLVMIDSDHVTHVIDTSGEPPVPRMHHSAVVVGDQMIVFGGRAGPLNCFNDVLSFDFKTSTWTPLSLTGDDSPSPRWKHSCSVVGSTMYVFGGRDGSVVFNDLFALDFGASELAWKKIDCREAPSARFDHVGVALTHARQLLIWSGLSSLDQTCSADDGRRDLCWLFDISSHTWQQCPIKNADQGPATGLFASAVCTIDEGAHVIVCGGTSSATASVDTTKAAVQKVFSLSVATMEWQLLGTVENHSNHKAALVYSTCTWLRDRSELFLVGGGFQVFGFGQCYSASFVCELIVVTKDGARGSPPPRTASVPVSTPTPALTTSSTVAVKSVVDTSQPLGVLAEKTQVKVVKTILEGAKVYDKSRRVRVMPNRVLVSGSPAFLLPVTSAFSTARQTSSELAGLELVVDDDAYQNKFGKATGSNRNDVVRLTVESFARRHNLPSSVVSAIPDKYEFVSDVLLVPRGSFEESEWAPVSQAMWAAVCETTTPRLSRVARKAFIDPGEKRQSHVELLYVNPSAIQSSRPASHGWVEVRENGITYGWDLTKVMFSSGNVTEKARMGSIGCQGDVIVDLFCGIGYYVVPFLVHGGAAFVHACEWNPDSVDALKFNLTRNHVAHKCQIYAGDNQIHAPTIGAVADRVNLGLLPTSEKAWPLAVQVMKPQGGWMHVHDNVAVEDRERWEQHVVTSMTQLALQFGKHWRVTCEHVEKVKSYAPKVHHLVADIKCVAIVPSGEE